MNSISVFKCELINKSPTAQSAGGLRILSRLPPQHAHFLRAKMMMELGREGGARKYAKKSIECDLKKQDFLDAAEKAKLFGFPELMREAGEGFYQYTLDWDAENRPGFANLVGVEVMRAYGVSQEFISEANLRWNVRMLIENKGEHAAEEFAAKHGRPELVEEAIARQNKADPYHFGQEKEFPISPSASLLAFTPEILQEMEADPSKIEDDSSRLIELARGARGEGKEELSVRLARLSIHAKLAEWETSRHIRNAAAAEAKEFGQADIVREIGFRFIDDALKKADVPELRAIAAKSGISEQELVAHIAQRIDKEIRDGYSRIFAWLKPMSETLGLSMQLKAISLIEELAGLPCSLNIFSEKA